MANLDRTAFEVRCGGIPQSIQTVDSIGLPIDVVLLADIAWPNGFIPDENFDRALLAAIGTVGDSVKRMAIATIQEIPGGRALTGLTASQRQLRDAVERIRELRTKRRRGSSALLERALAGAIDSFGAYQDDRQKRRVILLLGYDQQAALEADTTPGVFQALDRLEADIIAVRLPLKRFSGRAQTGVVIGGGVIREKAGGLAEHPQPPKRAYEYVISKVAGRLVDAPDDAPDAVRRELAELKNLYRLWFVFSGESAAAARGLPLEIRLTSATDGTVETRRRICPL